MRINARNQERLKIKVQDTEDVNEFTLLGAIVCKEGGGVKDLKNKLSKARGTFIRLKKNIELWQHLKKNKTKTV